MRKINILAGALALVGAVGTASAAELIATVVPGSGKANPAIALDISSNGEVAGFSFRIDAVGAQMAKADLSKCVSALPKGFSASCSVAKGSVFVYATADAATTVLPAGVTSIGTIYLTDTQSLAKAGKLQIQVQELSASDAKANAVEVTANVAAE